MGELSAANPEGDGAELASVLANAPFQTGILLTSDGSRATAEMPVQTTELVVGDSVKIGSLFEIMLIEYWTNENRLLLDRPENPCRYPGNSR